MTDRIRISVLVWPILAALLATGCAGTGSLRGEDAGGGPQQVEPVLNMPDSEVIGHTIRGAIFETQGDYLRALHQYRRALLSDSSQVELYHAAADMHEKLGELESASLMLEQGVRKLNDLTLLEHLGELQLRRSDNQGAVASYQNVLEQAPDNLYARRNLAQAYERAGMVDSALAVYETILQREDVDPEPYMFRMVALYERSGRHERAIDVYDRLRDMQPGEDRIPFLMGSLYLDMGDTTEALNTVTAATWMRPVEPRYWDMRLRLLIVLDRADEAVELGDSALAFNPGDAELHGLVASIYSREGLDDRAAATLRSAIDLAPANPLHYVNLGYLMHEMERWDEAEALYEDALKLSPGDAQVLNNYAYLLAERGERLEDALEMSTDAVSIEPENASYLDTKGWIHFRLGQLQDARTYLERAVRIAPHHPEILEHLGDVHEALGDLEMARDYWRRALEVGGPDEAISRKLDD